MAKTNVSQPRTARGDKQRGTSNEKQDVLYLGREGQEEEAVEISPGVNVELDKSGNVIGLEVFNAAARFRHVIKPMEEKIEAA